MPLTHGATVLRTSNQRSRVTNGHELLPGIDARSAVYRRYRDLVAIIATDQGGVDRLAEARMQLVRRFAALSVEAENMEARLCSGTPLPIADYCLIVSTLTRVASRIGISRTAKDITPTLSKYLKDASDEEIEAEAYEDA